MSGNTNRLFLSVITLFFANGVYAASIVETYAEYSAWQNFDSDSQSQQHHRPGNSFSDAGYARVRGYYLDLCRDVAPYGVIDVSRDSVSDGSQNSTNMRRARAGLGLRVHPEQVPWALFAEVRAVRTVHTRVSIYRESYEWALTGAISGDAKPIDDQPRLSSSWYGDASRAWASGGGALAAASGWGRMSLDLLSFSSSRVGLDVADVSGYGECTDKCSGWLFGSGGISLVSNWALGISTQVRVSAGRKLIIPDSHDQYSFLAQRLLISAGGEF